MATLHTQREILRAKERGSEKSQKVQIPNKYRTQENAKMVPYTNIRLETQRMGEKVSGWLFFSDLRFSMLQSYSNTSQA